MNPYVAVGLIGGAVKAYDYVTTSTHDRVLKKSFKAAKRSTSDAATLYVDHIKDDVESPAGVVADINGVPDLIVHEPHGRSLIVEVETSESLQDQPGHAVEQLEDFATRGFKRVLVVPDNGEDVANAFVEDHDLDGAVVVATPGEIPTLV